MTHPDIYAKMKRVYLEDEQTILRPGVMDNITSDEEHSAAAASNANIERNNSLPDDITGVYRQYQESTKITPITPNF